MKRQSRRLSISESILSLLLRAIPIKYGKHKLLDIIAPKAWNNTGMSVIFSLNGHEVVVNPYDLVGWHFLMLRSFDPEVVKVLEMACDPKYKEILWDIGANKGACCCSLATKLPLLHVVAIEPQAQLYANNIANLESICSGRYEYVRGGVGDEEAELTLVIPSSNLGGASLHIQKTSPNDVVEEIKLQTASQIADSSKFGWPTIIKIDVEGHEKHVFKSLQPFIESKACKVIVFESHAAEVEAFGAIKEMAALYGYQIYGISKSPWAITLVPAAKQLPGVADYAAIRSGLLEENKRLANIVA